MLLRYFLYASERNSALRECKRLQTCFRFSQETKPGFERMRTLADVLSVFARRRNPASRECERLQTCFRFSPGDETWLRENAYACRCASGFRCGSHPLFEIFDSMYNFNTFPHSYKTSKSTSPCGGMVFPAFVRFFSAIICGMLWGGILPRPA